MRIRLGKGFWASRWGLAILGTTLALLLTGIGVFTYYYIVYARMIDERLSGNLFQHTTGIYTQPGRIFNGQAINAANLEDYLGHSGYIGKKDPVAPGYLVARGNTLEVYPGKTSYFHGGNAIRVEFAGKTIHSIRSIATAATMESAEIEPELLTNLFNESREKRRPVKFTDLPKNLVNALLAAEDKRFFEHPGFDAIRVAGAALADMRHGGKAQGASTLDMQLARSFSLRRSAPGIAKLPRRWWRCSWNIATANNKFSSFIPTKFIWAIAEALRFTDLAKRRRHISEKMCAI